MAASTREGEEAGNGAALAALLGAGIGALALGLVVVLNEMKLLAVPALYAPAGGVTGRTALATAIWLAAWAALHARWKGRRIESSAIEPLAWVLIALGVVLNFPPVWRLL